MISGRIAIITKNEARVLVEFCDELYEQFSNDGCNEMYLPNTVESRQIIKQAYGKEEGIVEDDKICVDNQIILIYLRNKLKKEYEID